MSNYIPDDDTIEEMIGQKLSEEKKQELARLREEKPDEIVLQDVKIFHLESMNEKSLWCGLYTLDNKIYHLNISAKGDELFYTWSDETPE